MPDVTFGAVSLQLKALLEAGLIEARVPQSDKAQSLLQGYVQRHWGDGKMLERMWETTRFGS